MTLALAVNTTALVLSPLTGIGQYTKQLMLEMEKRADVDPHFFYATFWSKSLNLSAPPELHKFKSFIKKFVPRPYESSRFLQQPLFKAGLKRYRLSLYHEPNFIPYRTDIPTIITVHDLSYLRYPETHPASRVRIMSKLLPPAIERATRILTDSDFVRKEIIEVFAVAPEKVVTTHLGVSPAFRPMSAEETLPTLARLGLQHGKYLLAVGTLEPRKNLLLTLRAYRRLPQSLREEFPLVVVGMKGWHTETLESELEELLRSGQVRLPGYISAEDLCRLYAGGTMLVYPSLYEGFGLPLLEGMASGIPVVTANRSSLPEVVGDAGIVIDPDDDAALLESILTLLESPTETASLRMRGIARAAKFTWAKCAETTADAYSTCMAV